MTTDDRLQRMEDIHAIAQLKTRYTEFANSWPANGWPERRHSSAGIEELFTHDATWHIVPTGPPLVGIEAIKARFDDDTLFPFSYHLLGNPWIDVDGDEGLGRWHVVVAFRMEQTGPMWVTGFYEDRFIRQSGGWRIRSLLCNASGAAPFGQSW